MSNSSNLSVAVVIMSGLPGSGKSTWIKKHSKDETVCSADHFFMRDGEYCFNPSQLGEAHASCMRRFIDALSKGQNVIVDNTNLSWDEISPYYSVAKAFGAKVSLCTVECSMEVAHSRCVHGVPLVAYKGMQQRLRERKIPPFVDMECYIIGSEMGGDIPIKVK